MRSAVLLPDFTYFWLKLDFALGHTDGWEIKGEKNPDLYSEGIQWLCCSVGGTPLVHLWEKMDQHQNIK